MFFASLVAIFSSFNLVLQPSQSSRTHHDLAKKFIKIEQELITKEDFTQEELNKLTSKRLDIEAEEPPPLQILNCICHNELARAMGYGPEHMVKIKWYQRLFKDFFDINDHKVCPE